MNTDRLFEFQVLAQTLHYGKAAAKLYMSQPVLSRHIQDLEAEIGAELFSRSSHKVTLTAAGIALYRFSRRFLNDVRLATERVNTAGLGIAGTVRFDCMRPVYSFYVGKILADFCRNYPDILLSTNISDQNAPDQYNDCHFVALTTTAMYVPDQFRLERVFEEKSWLVLPPNHPFQSYGEVSLSDLRDETLFLPGFHGSIGSFAQIGRLVERSTAGHVRIIRVASPETALLQVFLGHGTTILPRHRIDELTQKFHHVGIKEDCRFETLFFKNETAQSPASELFGDEFIKQMSIAENN
ncbi:MAG: LysR substrate-binding domain-containing protein [Lachnospiraceae bacterium]|jgi:DNA-binding transcriptional LysR family regulator